MSANQCECGGKLVSVRLSGAEQPFLMCKICGKKYPKETVITIPFAPLGILKESKTEIGLSPLSIASEHNLKLNIGKPKRKRKVNKNEL